MFKNPVSFVLVLFMAAIFIAWVIADYVVRGSNGAVTLLPFAVIFILGLLSGASLMNLYIREKENGE
jgi:glucose-6-phosphate-specific signal transduction histidine kinase